jgi:ABC-2 type transport system permease protein
MSAWSALISVTVRGLLGRRRLLLMLLLASVPVLLGVLVQLRGGRPNLDAFLGLLIVQTVMPLVALILGTSALGSEIEDGTAVYLLIKPVQRWIVALAKIVVAVAATAILVVPITVLTGLLVGGFDDRDLSTTFAFALACFVGGTAYAAVFVALSAMTARALVIGLVYVLLWEGALGGLLEGTKFLSIRQATLGVADGLGGQVSGHPIDGGVAAAVLTIAILLSLLMTSWRLSRFEIKGGD